MSASERLRALDGALLPPPWEAWGGSVGTVAEDVNDHAEGGLTVGPEYDNDGHYIGEGRISGGIKLNTDALVALRHALPLIADCLEAAEVYLREYTQGRPALTIGIEQSLSALREHLEATDAH